MNVAFKLEQVGIILKNDSAKEPPKMKLSIKKISEAEQKVQLTEMRSKLQKRPLSALSGCSPTRTPDPHARKEPKSNRVTNKENLRPSNSNK